MPPLPDCVRGQEARRPTLVSRRSDQAVPRVTTVVLVSRVKLPWRPAIASSDPLYRNGEYISDAALGLDDARCARIALELTPQAENLHIDAAVEDIFVNAGRLQ